jgi:hypothetical protein
MFAYNPLSEQSALPASLTQLALIGSSGTHFIPDLPNLQVLHQVVDFEKPSLLSHVSRLPMLQTLVLELTQYTTGVSRAAADAVAAHVARATQITCLRVYRNGVDRPPPRERVQHDRDVSLSLLGSLRGLPHLRELTGSGLRLQAEDVLGWTQLSGLTSLELEHCRDVTDTAAAALACKLTGLRRLSLASCGLSSPVLWPAFAAGCIGLHELHLQGNPLPLSDATLMLLTSLTCLTSLSLPAADQAEADAAPAVSAAAVQQFRSAMPQLRVLKGL